jgi:hypothetical protein
MLGMTLAAPAGEALARMILLTHHRSTVSRSAEGWFWPWISLAQISRCRRSSARPGA